MTTLLAATVATLVFCAPGYPGGAGDAQPFVDQFAGAAVKAAGWPAGSLAAIYDPTDEGSLAKLGAADAVLAFVPYPFFVEHGAQLHLSPLVQADVTGTGTQQKWEGQALKGGFRLDLQNIENGYANFSIQTNGANSKTIAKCMMEVDKSFGQGQLFHALQMSRDQKKSCYLTFQ